MTLTASIQATAAALCAAAMFFLTPVVHGDQLNPRLDTLFNELAKQELTESEARSLTNEIWQIWHEVDEPETASRFESGLNLMRDGNLPEAVSQFTHVITLSPEFAEAWNKRATLYWMMGEPSLSATDIKKTLELEPRHFGALSGLGLLYSQLEQNDAAIKAFKEALLVNPHLPGVKRNLETLQELEASESENKPST